MNNTKVGIQAAQRYRAVWRWHFYAGVFVLPFLLILSLSALLMLVSKPLEALWYQHLLRVDVQPQMLPASALLDAVKNHYPHSEVQLFIPSPSADTAAQFSLRELSTHNHDAHNGASTTVYVDPYSAQILGSSDPSTTLYNWAKDLHGSLLLGDIGDILIEITAGLAVLMIISGLYLAWPRQSWQAFWPRFSLKNREDWRILHRFSGWLISLPLLFLLISGLAWTNVWGAKLVQAWSAVPGTRYQPPQDSLNHDSMNIHGQHRVPWALEQTPLPHSGDHPGRLQLDDVSDMAGIEGFEHYRVHFPQDEKGVWTVSATTMGGDIVNPLLERIVHIDQFSGEPLADIRFADYSLMGQAMATFVPLHQGDLGPWNWLLNLLSVLIIMLLLIGGVVLWWKRRPHKQLALAPPKALPQFSMAVMLVMLCFALCFPLSAVMLLAISLLDALVLSRFKRLQTWFK